MRSVPRFSSATVPTPSSASCRRDLSTRGERGSPRSGLPLPTTLNAAARTARMGSPRSSAVSNRGVTAEQGRADLSAIQAALAQSYPEIRYRNGASVQSKLADMTGDIRPALLMLMAAVFAVLLIVCTNVAGLMLSRTMKRSGEMALRTALGASQWRVWRQLLIESLLLGLLRGRGRGRTRLPSAASHAAAGTQGHSPHRRGRHQRARPLLHDRRLAGLRRAQQPLSRVEAGLGAAHRRHARAE